MKKVLITGAEGMVFSKLIRKSIYERDLYSWISIDRFTQNTARGYSYINKNHKLYYGDISDANFLDILFDVERPELVIHGAVETVSDQIIQTNIMGTQALINASLKWGVKKFVYLSDAKVYGDLINETNPPWKETDLIAPIDLYAASKTSGELLVKVSNLKYNIIRLSNCYGEKQSVKHLIPTIINSILKNQSIPIYGQGLETRDWIYLEDACAAILTILATGNDNEIYNLSAGHEFSNMEVAQKICTSMGKGHNLISFIPDPKIKNRAFRRAVSSDKLRALGWKPELKFSEGIKYTQEWFQKNQAWAFNS